MKRGQHHYSSRHSFKKGIFLLLTFLLLFVVVDLAQSDEGSESSTSEATHEAETLSVDSPVVEDDTSHSIDEQPESAEVSRGEDSDAIYLPLPEEEVDEETLAPVNEEPEQTTPDEAVYMALEEIINDSEEAGFADEEVFTIEALAEEDNDPPENSSVLNDSEENSTQSSYQAFSISALTTPSSILSELPFFFLYALSSNTSSVMCDITILDAADTIAYQTSALSFSWNPTPVSNGDYAWEVKCFYAEQPSVNSTLEGSFVLNIPLHIEASFSQNQNAVVNSSVSFTVDINFSQLVQSFFIINFGDGESTLPIMLGNYTYHTSVEHTYRRSGTFIANLSMWNTSSLLLTREHSVSVADVNQSISDTVAPRITLHSPADNAAIINDSAINFSYFVSDASRLANCSFSIYIYNRSGGLVGTVAYEHTTSGFTTNESFLSTSLTGFEQGNYSWYVECRDIYGNYEERGRDFRVTANATPAADVLIGGEEYTELAVFPSSEEQEAEETLTLVDDFFVREAQYSLEQREVLEEMGILEKLHFYKRKLVQIKLDLAHNLRYIAGDALRDQRKQEILAELAKIRSEIPLGIEVGEVYEYSKTSPSTAMEDIAQTYIFNHSMVLSSGEMDTFVGSLTELQTGFSLWVKVRPVTIIYNDSTSQITLVSKTITNSATHGEVIVEVIPRDLVEGSDSIEFYTDEAAILGSEEAYYAFEIPLDTLGEDDMLVYSLEDVSDSQKVSESDTFLFADDLSTDGGLWAVSGFASALSFSGKHSFGFYFGWAVFITIFLSGGIFGMQQLSVRQLRKGSDMQSMLGSIAFCEKALRLGDIDGAKPHYELLRSEYARASSGSQRYLYKKVSRIAQKINTFDIERLVAEFISAVKEQRSKDADRLYKNIQSLYGSISADDKKNIFERISPYVEMFKPS